MKETIEEYDTKSFDFCKDCSRLIENWKQGSYSCWLFKWLPHKRRLQLGWYKFLPIMSQVIVQKFSRFDEKCLLLDQRSRISSLNRDFILKSRFHCNHRTEKYIIGKSYPRQSLLTDMWVPIITETTRLTCGQNFALSSFGASLVK